MRAEEMRVLLTSSTWGDGTASTRWEEVSRGFCQPGAMTLELKSKYTAVEALQMAYDVAAERSADLIVYVHSDVTIHEEWLSTVKALFANDDDLAIVGLGGATGIGVDDLYKIPYEIEQLQRINYASNQTDWRVHGTREEGGKYVAVIDGFFMAVRMDFLRRLNGWKWFQHEFHCYDTCLCLEAWRMGYTVKMVGVSCTHHGGGISCLPAYQDWLKERGVKADDLHRLPHEWMYERYRDILPLRITEGGGIA